MRADENIAEGKPRFAPGIHRRSRVMKSADHLRYRTVEYLLKAFQRRFQPGAASIPFLVLAFLAGSALLLAGCSQPSAKASSNQSDYFLIVTEFREFYDLLGGEELLGPVLSPQFVDNGLTYQYTRSALMVHNPNGDDTSRFLLAPLGMQLDRDYGLVSDEARAGEPEIYPPFIPLYERLGGARFVGLPLGAAQYDVQNRRYVQHFTNLGFYQLEEDEGRIGLLPYGVWMQGEGPVGIVRKTPAPQIGPALPAGISVEVWKSADTLQTDLETEVGVKLSSEGKPVSGLEPVLVLYMPDGSSEQVQFPPSNDNGETSLSLPEIEADNGTLIPLEVCVEASGASRFCVRESLLVWDLP